jgi:Cof subfamily protein (haloacid dehalogenase superfamily)
MLTHLPTASRGPGALAAYRLAAIDLDETLLGPDLAVSARNAAAVRLLKAKGLTVVLASGRRLSSTCQYCAPLGLADPVVCYNGALASWPARGETLHHLRLPADVAAEVVRACQARGDHLDYDLDEVLYVREWDAWSEKYHFRPGAGGRGAVSDDPVNRRAEPTLPSLYSSIQVAGDLTRFAGREPTKLILIGPPETVSRMEAEMSARYGDRITLMVSNPEYLEFLPKGVDKALGLAAVGRRLGIAPEEMIAFGDGPNDAAMLAYAGLGIAMGNAPEAVKRAADRVTATNGEDGVAQAIEQLFG